MAPYLSPEEMKEKLARALKAKAVLAERSRRLFQQLEDFRNRERSQDHVTSELLERQRELNYMLHRASSVLHQLQDTNLALSAEFTHIVKELPAPKESGWDDTISRVEDLFKKTHELAGEMQDEIFRTTSEPAIPKMKTGEADPSAPQAAVATDVQDPPVQVDHAPPTDAQDAEFRPADEPETPDALEQEPPKDETPEDIFARLDAYEAEKSSSSKGPAKRGVLERMVDWLNRDS